MTLNRTTRYTGGTGRNVARERIVSAEVAKLAARQSQKRRAKTPRGSRGRS